MQKSSHISIFILFLEEFFFWTPGQISTVCELLSRAIVLPINEDWLKWVYLLNPALSILLFLRSIGSITNISKSALSHYANPRWIVWLNRHSVIRYIPVTIVFILLLFRVREILLTGNLNVLDLYQNKPFWLVLFIAIFLSRFFSPDDKSI